MFNTSRSAPILIVDPFDWAYNPARCVIEDQLYYYKERFLRAAEALKASSQTDLMKI